MRALQVMRDDAGQRAEIVDLSTDDLGEGDVTIAVDYSAVNYKDGLGVTGASRVMKRFPLVGGIDLAGVVESAPLGSGFEAGDKVTVNGRGLAFDHHGGYATRARVPAAWITRIPERFSTWQAAAIGTAGYTAALSIAAIKRHDIAVGDGPVIVTGAAGGVGSVAVALLGSLGYDVHASTGRPGEKEYLWKLGATAVIDRAVLSVPGEGPLAPERWAAGVDTVGSHTLVNVLAQIKYGGIVANCGLAQGIDLPGSVAPFILRSVTLAGIESVNAPAGKRVEAWSLLDAHLDAGLLESMSNTIGLGEVESAAQQVLAGAVRGRTVVDVNA